MSTSIRTRARATFTSWAYKVYLRMFGRGTNLFAVSERIVEYPFAVGEALKLSRGSRVLVFGCHSDMLTTLLPTIGLDTHGVDVKDFELPYKGFTFHRGDVRKTEFPDASFDAVFAVSTIEHIGLFDGDDTGDRKAVGEMRRVVKPGGAVILTVPFASRAEVIPAFERIYDRPSLDRLLDGLEVQSIAAYAAEPGALWRSIDPKEAPPPQHQTSCTALVTARKRPQA